LAQPQPKTARRVRRDAEHSRAEILKAAVEVFAEFGLAGARVDEIAARAGVNKALLYHYYPGKEGLFAAALESVYADIRLAESGLDLESMSPEHAITRLVDFTLDHFLAHPEFLALVSSENRHGARHLRESEHLREMHLPLVVRIEALLGRGVAAGVFRDGVDPLELYISIAALGYFYLSNVHTLSAVFSRDLMAPAALRARREHMRQVVLGYLRPLPKGEADAMEGEQR